MVIAAVRELYIVEDDSYYSEGVTKCTQRFQILIGCIGHDVSQVTCAEFYKKY